MEKNKTNETNETKKRISEFVDSNGGKAYLSDIAIHLNVVPSTIISILAEMREEGLLDKRK